MRDVVVATCTMWDKCVAESLGRWEKMAPKTVQQVWQLPHQTKMWCGNVIHRHTNKNFSHFLRHKFEHFQP